MLLPPCSAAGVAEGAWAGPDVQHFADQPLRAPSFQGTHCLTFWYNLSLAEHAQSTVLMSLCWTWARHPKGSELVNMIITLHLSLSI